MEFRIELCIFIRYNIEIIDKPISLTIIEDENAESGSDIKEE